MLASAEQAGRRRIFVNAHQIPNDKLLWYTLIHLTFVISALLVAYMG